MTSRTRFPLEPVDESFFEVAPFRLQESFRIARPAPEVWSELTDDQTLRWCRLITSVTWTAPRPFGPGTTRTVSALAGQNVLHERYFLWEEGRRKAFGGVRANLPLFHRFAEDYLVEPTSGSSCTFTWTVAIEPRLPTRLAAAIDRRLFASLFTDTRRYFTAS